MVSTEQRYAIFRKIFYFSGLAFFRDGNSFIYKVYSIMIPIMVFTHWLSMLVDCLLHLDDLGHIIEDVSVILPHLLSVWIYLIFWFRKDEIEKLMYMTEQFTWEEMPVRNPETGSLTMAGAIPRIQKIVRAMIFVICGPHSVYMILRAISSRDLLGFNSWFPFDTRSSPVHEALLVFHLFVGLVIVGSYVSDLGLYAMLVSIACTQLTKVQNLLLILESEKLHQEKGIKNNDLGSCIILHQKVLDYMSAIQDTFNPLLFLHFATIMIGTAFACFGGVMSWGNVGEVYQICVVFFGQMMLLGTYCLLGTELATQAENVKFAAYSSDWIGAPISEQKSLMFIMTGANEFIIAAGGFIPATRETMLAVINQAFSYTMFLLNFKEDEDSP